MSDVEGTEAEVNNTTPSEVERLKSELKMAELAEKLEEARDAMHADRNEETIADYRKASEKMAAQRTAHRERYRVEPGPDDAAPTVETVTSEGAVNE